MRAYQTVAAAKINLYLEILGHRPDGYHELAMVMQSVDVCDRLEVSPCDRAEIRLYCDAPGVPNDERNLAWRAASLMAERFGQAWENLGGIEIAINKFIPAAAGLAGGSTDAAAVLVALNLMWNLGLTVPELQGLAADIGSDVAFCIEGGTALATGRGEKISPLPPLEGCYAVLGKHRDLEVSTAWAYQTYRDRFGAEYASDLEDLEARRQRVHSGPMVSAIGRQNLEEIADRLRNDLERVVLPDYPQVARLRETLLEAGAAGAMMSGSGPSVFGLAPSKDRADEIARLTLEKLDAEPLDLWVVELISRGIAIA